MLPRLAAPAEERPTEDHASAPATVSVSYHGHALSTVVTAAH